MCTLDGLVSWHPETPNIARVCSLGTAATFLPAGKPGLSAGRGAGSATGRSQSAASGLRQTRLGNPTLPLLSGMTLSMAPHPLSWGTVSTGAAAGENGTDSEPAGAGRRAPSPGGVGGGCPRGRWAKLSAGGVSFTPWGFTSASWPAWAAACDDGGAPRGPRRRHEASPEPSVQGGPRKPLAEEEGSERGGSRVPSVTSPSPSLPSASPFGFEKVRKRLEGTRCQVGNTRGQPQPRPDVAEPFWTLTSPSLQ